MCNCGCNTCETKGPLLTEGKVKSLLSEGLQYHINKKIPLFETIYRMCFKIPWFRRKEMSVSSSAKSFKNKNLSMSMRLKHAFIDLVG